MCLLSEISSKHRVATDGRTAEDNIDASDTTISARTKSRLGELKPPNITAFC